MNIPPFEEIIKGDDPDRLYVIRRSLQSIFPRLLLFLLLCAVAVWGNVQFGDSVTAGYLRWLSVFPILVLLDIVRIYYDDLYIFSAHKLTRLQGRVSFQYTVPSVSYSDIRGIVVSQSFMGRLLNYGDISLGTAAHDGNELAMIGIEDPYEVSELIEKFRKSNNRGVSEE